MLRIAAAAIVWGLLLTAPARAADLPGDADHDGKVSLAEFQASRLALVMRSDLNGNGQISAGEWASQAQRLNLAVATRGYPSMGQSSQRAIFPQVDTNGDGIIDRAEIDAATRGRFEELDKDRDGYVAGPEAQQLIAEAKPLS